MKVVEDPVLQQIEGQMEIEDVLGKDFVTEEGKH